MADLTSQAASVGALLKERGETVAVAESSAGGLIAAALLAVPGASVYFKGGGVVYTSASKQILIGVSDVWQYVIKGLVIIGAVALDRYRLQGSART